MDPLSWAIGLCQHGTYYEGCVGEALQLHCQETVTCYGSETSTYQSKSGVKLSIFGWLPVHMVVTHDTYHSAWQMLVERWLHVLSPFPLSSFWSGPFYHVNDINVYPAPQQKKWISCTCAQSWTMSGSYIFLFRTLALGQTLQKRPQDYHPNPG